MRLHRPWLLLVVMVLALAGCGSSSGGGGGDAGADPAQAVPPGALAYVEGVVRPEGSQGDAARALLEKFLPSGTTLESLLDDALKDNDRTYAKDIEPWLGQRVGVGVTDFSAGDAGFVAAVAITDSGKAEGFLKQTGKKDGDYYVDDDTFAVVQGDYLLFSKTKADLAAGVKAAKGDSLGDASGFKDAIGELPDERLGAVYVDLAGIVDSVSKQPDFGAAQQAVLKQFLGDGKLKPLTAALTATENSATIESRFNGGGLAKLGSLGLLGTGAPTDLIKDVPADAFATFGAADVGPSLKALFDTAIGAFGGAAVSAQLEAQTGLNLQRDVFSWIGDVAVYAHGTTPKTVNGALVIKALDEDAAAKALPKLIAAAQRSGAPIDKATVKGADQAYSTRAYGAPGDLVIAQGGDRVVLAYGAGEAAAALTPPSDTLGSGGRYDDAEEAIDGIAPSLIVDIAKVLVLAEASGAGSDADYQEAKPYLEKLDLAVTGSEKDGDTLRSLFTVTVR